MDSADSAGQAYQAKSGPPTIPGVGVFERGVLIECSGYVSRKPMRVAAVFTIAETLKDKFPILNTTVQEMHLTEVGDTYELTNLFGVDG